MRELEVDIADRRQHAADVAVRHPEARVGKDLRQRVDEERVGRTLQPPARRRAMPLQELQHPLDVAIGGHEIRLVSEPSGVTRDMRERLKDLRFEVMAHEGLTFGRSARRCRQHDLHARKECLAAGQRLLGHGDAWVIVLRPCLGRRAGRDRFPGAQEAGCGVLRQQAAERRRSGTRQPQANQRRLDLLLVDLRMLCIAVLHLQPPGQEIDDLAVECRAAAFGEPRFLVGGGDEDFQSLPKAVFAEVIQGSRRPRLSHQIVGTTRTARLHDLERPGTGWGGRPAVIR